MKNSTFRLIIVLAVVSIMGIIVIQVFWMGRAFDIRNKQFNHNVNIALLNTASTLCELNQHALSPDPIEQLSANYFVVNVNNRIDPDLLENVLRREFTSREIAEDFEYGIFDCANEEMVYGNRIDLTKTLGSQEVSSSFPELNKDAYYFGVYFPNKPSNLAGEMGIWVFSTAVLVVVVAFFGYALFAIFRQRKLSEIQKDFINNMTHEFKTPISTIALSTDVIVKPDIIHQPDRLSQYAGIIKKETTRLQNQVDKVLQIATLEKSSLQLKKQPVNLNELVELAIQSADLSLAEKGGKVEFQKAEPLPELMLDQVHITNVIYNLIDNAIKYNDRPPLIQVSTQVLKDTVVMKISDNGKGIGKKEKDLIFRKFYRVSTGNVHDVKGFGLGLYYVKTVIEAHHGKIHVDSSPEGTTFTLTFKNG